MPLITRGIGITSGIYRCGNSLGGVIYKLGDHFKPSCPAAAGGGWVVGGGWRGGEGDGKATGVTCPAPPSTAGSCVAVAGEGQVRECDVMALPPAVCPASFLSSLAGAHLE